MTFLLHHAPEILVYAIAASVVMLALTFFITLHPNPLSLLGKWGRG